MQRSLCRPLHFGAGTLAIVLGLAASRGQTIGTATWNGGTGNWGSAGSWSGGVVPDSGTFDAVVDNKAATASLASITFYYPQVTLRNLRIDSNDTVSMGSNTSLTAATLLNSGTLAISSSGSLNFTGAGDSVSGSGKILLSGGTISSATVWVNGGNSIIGSGSLSNLQGNTGTLLGNIGGKTLTLDLTGAGYNAGTIAASGGNVYVASGKLSNSGLLTATAGSQLSFAAGAALSNTGTGQVYANGGSISIFPAQTLGRDDEYVAANGGSIYFDNLTTSGHTLSGATASGYSFATLNNNSGTISSSGSVLLGNTTNSGGRILLDTSSASGAVTNALVNNAAGTISINNNAAFTLQNNAVLTGGTFVSSTGGVLNVTGIFNYSGGTIRDLTNNGTINLATNANVAGMIDGSGALNFQNGYQYFSVGTDTLGGTGTANLTYCNADAAYSASGGSVTLINDVNHALSGYGSFCSNTGGTTKTLINRGLMQSTPIGTSSGTLLTGGNHFTNAATGTLRVLTNSALYIGSSDFTSLGTIDVQANGTFNVSSSSGTATIASISNAGTVGLSQTSASIGSISGGTLLVNETSGFTVDGMNVTYFSSGGTVSLVAGADKPAVKAKTFLSYALDVNDRGVVVDYDGTSPLASLTTKIKAGYASAGGRWAAAGNAIYSTNAAADPAHRAIGIAQLSTLFGSSVPTTFLGQSVDATTVALRYTYAGDANLDGMVNVVDLGLLASHWQQSGLWSGGDFNYDGKIDVVDLGILASDWQFGTSGPGMSFAEAMKSVGLSESSVPEPTILPLALLLIRRRRRALPR